MQNLTVRMQLSLAFASLAALVLGVALLSLYDLRSLNETSQQQTKATFKASEASYATQRAVLAGLCALSLAVAVALGWWITRRLVGALGAEPADLNAVAQRVADGDLSPLRGAEAAPARSVLAAMAHMQHKLVNLISQVRCSSTASMQQMTESVRVNAESAQQACQLASALAQRSASAAREIKTLIGESIGQAGGTMDDIVRQVRRVNDLITEISASTLQQSSGITQVNQAVASIDQGTQQNAALVEESAAAAESLSQQAKGLAQVISLFRIAAQRDAGAPAPGAFAHATPSAAYL